MKQYIKKILVAGLGAAAIMLCVTAQAAWAAPTEHTVSEAAVETAEAAATAAAALTATAPVAESVGYDSVTLTWEAVNDAFSYELQQSSDKKNYETIAAFTPDQELRHTAAGLYTAKAYYYRVVVKDERGNSVASKPLKVKAVLSAPVVTKLAQSGSDTVDIEWTQVEGAVFYRVYRSTTPVGGFKNVKSVYGTSYTNRVPADATYYYKIMPVRYNPDEKKVRGKCSATHNVTVKEGVPVITGVMNSENNTLTVGWSEVTGASGYAVYRSLSKSDGYELVQEVGSDSLSWTDTSVEAGTKYFYKVSAGKTDSGKNSYGTQSAYMSKWTKSDAPGDLCAVQSGTGGVALKWTPSKAASSFRVYRAQGADENYTKIATKLTDSSYTDTGLVSGETYYYRVVAVHGSLVSEMSTPVSIKISTLGVNTRTLFLGPGVTASLGVTSESPETVTYSSVDDAIAVVDESGQVTGVAPGKTQIMVAVGAVTTSVSVTVTSCQLNGIDVSKWQQAINWKTVKESGIKFAMLRLAHGTSKDIQFETYYTGAMEQGIPVGIYCYSLAKSVDEGIAEAEYLLELLDGKELAYPIALDLEDNNQIKNMNKAARTELILEYKRIIEEAGYQFVVYANLNWLNNYIDRSRLAEENVDIWIARYRSQSLGHGYDGGGNVRMWQYSSTGKVDGILDAFGRYINVDLDVCYDGY